MPDPDRVGRCLQSRVMSPVGSYERVSSPHTAELVSIGRTFVSSLTVAASAVWGAGTWVVGADPGNRDSRVLGPTVELDPGLALPAP